MLHVGTWGQEYGVQVLISFFNLFLQSAKFVLIFLGDVYDQEDSNALKNTSLGYYMQKLQGFDLKLRLEVTSNQHP